MIGLALVMGKLLKHRCKFCGARYSSYTGRIRCEQSHHQPQHVSATSVKHVFIPPAETSSARPA